MDYQSFQKILFKKRYKICKYGGDKKFYEEQYDIDIFNPKYNSQLALRRPLLILMEYYETGSYFKSHHKSVALNVPKEYGEVFSLIQKEYINNLDNCISVKKRKISTLAKLVNYLYENNITDFKDVQISNISNYIDLVSKKYAKETIRTMKTALREILNWLYQKNIISFNGKSAFPLIKTDTRDKMLSTYTEEEIKKILESIDVSNSYGKCAYLVISLLAYYGLRAGDIINLKLENIDFANNSIKIIQRKTNKELILPLIDEVKFPLLDYLKNGKNSSADKEYIFSTIYAPYTKFNNTSSIYLIVSKAMKNAGINFENRRHGPHALRHSLATNMINNNVPISAISNVLGHSSTKTTEIYITKDTTHLRELTLEVPCNE